MSSNEPRKRLKAAESRRALLDAGLELLKVRGVAPGLDRVTLKEAIEVSGVPRSTAYRLYEGGKGQLEEFRADLLTDLDTAVDTGLILAAIDQAFADAAPQVESGDSTQLASALREVLRVAVNTSMDAIADSLEWRVYMSSLASAGTGADVDPDLTEVFRTAAITFGQRFTALFERMGTVFGLRTREPLSMADMGVLASAIVEGVALRHHVGAGLAPMQRATGANGDGQIWNAAAVAIEGLLLTSTEPNPSSSVSANLGTWTNWV